MDLVFGVGPANFRATVWEWVAYCVGPMLIVIAWRFLYAKDDKVPAVAAKDVESLD